MDDVGSTSLSVADRTMAVAGLVLGAIPFFVSYSESSSTTVNGVVTSAVYRDWISVGCGGAALVCGLIAVVLATKNKAGGARVGLAVGALALGGFQIARGFGVFAQHATSSSSVTITHTTSVPEPLPEKPKADPNTPEGCPNAEACNELGIKFEKANDLKNALAAFTQGCNLDNMVACTNEGNYWADGKGVTADPAKAMKLYTKACDRGDGPGCGGLGIMYYTGASVPKDVVKGLSLFEQACTAKDGNGCRNVGVVYRDDKKDNTKALEYFNTSCELKELPGCNSAGSLLMGMKQPAKAFEYFKRSCDGDNPTGCNNEGVCLENGNGTKKDLAKARELYAKACDGDYIDGCNALGVLYDNAQGGPKDSDKALELFQKACDGKNDEACKNVEIVKKRKKK